MQNDPNEDSPEYRAAYAKTLQGQLDELNVALRELWESIKRAVLLGRFRKRQLRRVAEWTA